MNRSDRPVLRAVTITVGFLTLIVGILFVTVPAIIKPGNDWILATLFILAAVMSAGFAATTLREDVRIYTASLSMLSLATGVFMVVDPLDRSVTLTTLLGIYFMIESGLYAGLGMSLRPHWSAAIMMFTVAAISFVMSALIWVLLAGASKSVIVDLVGISFIARGVAYIMLSLMMRGRTPLPPSEIRPGRVTQPTGA